MVELWNDDHPLYDLAKYDYEQDMKIKEFKYPYIFLPMFLVFGFKQVEV